MTDPKLTRDWQKSAANSNFILRGEGFFISFNPMPVKGSGQETALVDARNLPDRPFYVLRGDHRAAFEALVDAGFDACLDYYLRHRP
jgi:hypothetical protein